ncbi:MAG: type II toxin-antitoxin system PemK/MazF family toxin [Verrucomicrobia bacterium]|nr:type II toxin-antitoxin system PemK/MazF family toxin [Verrucomicrobiota bacterium]
MSKLTKTYDIYEVVKVPFPFTDVKAAKIRPALILSTAKHFNARIGLSILAMITSIKAEQELWPADIVIQDLASTNLPAPSIIRFKLFTLDHRLIINRLGILAPIDRKSVQSMLKEVLSL